MLSSMQESFYTLLAHNKVAEGHDKLVACYLSGLNPTLHKLTRVNFQTMEQFNQGSLNVKQYTRAFLYLVGQ